MMKKTTTMTPAKRRERFIRDMRPIHGLFALLPLMMGVTAVLGAGGALVAGADMLRGGIALVVGLLVTVGGYWVRPRIVALIERYPYHFMWSVFTLFTAITVAPAIFRAFR